MASARPPWSPAPERPVTSASRPPPALSETDVKYAKAPPKAANVLPAYIIRGLNDKVYDKRKQAALDIQRMTKEFIAAGDDEKVDQLIYVLKHEFCYNANGNAQKGGLIGLAGMATALSHESGQHLQDLIPPVLGCFSDPDSRVRYYACESLYNIAKAHRVRILPYFNEIFDGLSQLAGDNDREVRNGEELLDRLIKDIVLESTSFNIAAFIPLLKERIYTQNPFVRQFIVSWVQALDNVPDIELLSYLHEFLDGLFIILGDINDEIRKSASNLLTELLREIKANGVDYASVMHIVVDHSSSEEPLVQATAIAWLKEFIMLEGDCMLSFLNELLGALLLTLAHESPKTRDTAKSANQELMRVFKRYDQTRPLGELQLDESVEILREALAGEAVETIVASLRWLHLFREKQPERMFALVDSLLPSLLPALSDKHEEVALLCVEVLAEFAAFAEEQDSATDAVSWADVQPFLTGDERVKVEDQGNASLKPNKVFYRHLMTSLLDLFTMDSQLLDRRGALIICQLCTLLNPEKIFQEFATILLTQEDQRFAQHMVHTLNTILLSTVECRGLRARLKDLSKLENRVLFVTLYRSWCHNPVATLSLCLLSQAYEHAAELLQVFAQMEITVAFLLDIDRLVKILESPIFTYLRLQLLELRAYPYLGKCLFGILMLLPQSQAYHTLNARLHAVPPWDMPVSIPGDQELSKTSNKDIDINFTALMDHFRAVQAAHQDT